MKRKSLKRCVFFTKPRLHHKKNKQSKHISSLTRDAGFCMLRQNNHVHPTLHFQYLSTQYVSKALNLLPRIPDSVPIYTLSTYSPFFASSSTLPESALCPSLCLHVSDNPSSPHVSVTTSDRLLSDILYASRFPNNRTTRGRRPQSASENI